MQLRTAKGRELRKIKRIYLEAFPKVERKPFRMMKKKARQGAMEILSVVEGGRTVGLAVAMSYQDLVLLDYFAIARFCRGCGYGSKALGLIKERYAGKRLILEIELPYGDAGKLEERVRRKEFYLRNGMKETGIHARVFCVPMEALTAGSAVTYREYEEFYEKTIGVFFAKRVSKLNKDTAYKRQGQGVQSRLHDSDKKEKNNKSGQCAGEEQKPDRWNPREREDQYEDTGLCGAAYPAGNLHGADRPLGL